MSASLLTTNQWLLKAVHDLSAADIGTARLDALVLLSDITGKDRAQLLAHPEDQLTTEQQDTLQKLLNRRAQHEPLAYIREKTEFYGREFTINHSVLEPRPESETMIELLKQQPVQSIIDVGTGSGALAITAKLELPSTMVYAVDIDAHCLEVAQRNAQKLDAGITCIQSDLLEALQGEQLAEPIAVLANLPYVPDDYQINKAALQEPRLAIFGGADGLDLYRIMFEQLAEHFKQQIHVFTESLPFQHAELRDIATAYGFTQTNEEDFIQVFTRNT